jgi:hypothetical protein
MVTWFVREALLDGIRRFAWERPDSFCGGPLAFLARVTDASVTARLVCLNLLARLLQPVFAHHPLDSPNTLLNSSRI